MRLYAALALAGTILIVTHVMLRAQDSKAERARAIAEIKKLAWIPTAPCAPKNRPQEGRFSRGFSRIDLVCILT